MLDTQKNGLHKSVWSARRGYHLSRGPSREKNRKKWRGRGQENNWQPEKRGSGHRCLSMWEDAAADNQFPHPASIWHWKLFLSSEKNQQSTGEKGAWPVTTAGVTKHYPTLTHLWAQPTRLVKPGSWITLPTSQKLLQDTGEVRLNVTWHEVPNDCSSSEK